MPRVRRPQDATDTGRPWTRPRYTPFVPITEAANTCGLELMSTMTIGLPVSRETAASASSRGVLATEQLERGGGAGFADQLNHVADHGHDQIGMAGVGHGFIDQLLVDRGGDGRFSGEAGHPGRTRLPGRAPSR